MSVHLVNEQAFGGVNYPVVQKTAYDVHDHIDPPEKAQCAKRQKSEIYPAENNACHGEEKDTEHTDER